MITYRYGNGITAPFKGAIAVNEASRAQRMQHAPKPLPGYRYNVGLGKHVLTDRVARLPKMLPPSISYV